MRNWIKRLGFTLFTLFILLNIIAASHAYKFTHFYDTGTEAPEAGEMGLGARLGGALFGKKYYKAAIDSLPDAAYENISLQTSDHLQLAGWYIKADSMPHGTVILFHGHGGNRSSVVKEANAFHRLGWNVCMTDFRAHGQSQGNICTVGFNEAKDVKAAYDYVTAKGEKQVVLWGISLGAATAMKAIADYDLKPYKVILEMPFGSLQDAVRGRLRIMHLPAEPLATLLTFWGGAEQQFWAFDHKPWNYARKINCPVLLQWGIHDPRVTEEETHHIFKNLESRQKTLIKYAQSGHESLCKKEPEKWLACVQNFLDR
jgi:alpha-beta hydrolase superfamily lysophospholipase